MIELNSYGKVIRSYTGTGRLYFDEEHDAACTFEIAQLVDGRLYATCQISDYSLATLNQDKVLILRGETKTAETIILEQPR